LNDRYYKVIRKSILIRSTLGPSMELGGYILFAGFLVAVAHGWLGSDPNASAETSEVILQFFAALGFLLRPMRNVGEQLTRFQETMGALSTSLETFRAFDRLNAARSDSVTPPAFSSHPRPWRGITLHRVGAAYGGRVAFVGENIRVAPSQCVAIIGPSGSGKSTFIKTLAGLIEPSTWDATIPWAELTNEGTLVSQEPFLFDDSLRDNLLYGLEQAGIKITPDDDSVNRALASVNIADEIERLPDKLSTRVRAISSNFSGGQLQRLVIARALLRDKPLWLLDEATSAVDARTEKDITFRLIDAARRERKSLLMVTHRLRWLNAFDTIFFVEQGKILAAGSHVELQQHPVHGTRYRRFCQTAEDTSGEAR
jgi:ATP-binding cassette subfamily B protein